MKPQFAVGDRVQLHGIHPSDEDPLEPPGDSVPQRNIWRNGRQGTVVQVRSLGTGYAPSHASNECRGYFGYEVQFDGYAGYSSRHDGHNPNGIILTGVGPSDDELQEAIASITKAVTAKRGVRTMTENEMVREMERQIAEAKAAEDADRKKFNPRVSSKPGEPLTVDIDIDDNAGPDEIAAAMQAAAREAGLL